MGAAIPTGQGGVLSLIELKRGELISGGGDGSLRRWRADNPLGETINTGQGGVTSLIELSNGELIIGGEDGSLWGFLKPKAVIAEACKELKEHPVLLSPKPPRRKRQPETPAAATDS